VSPRDDTALDRLNTQLPSWMAREKPIVNVSAAACAAVAAATQQAAFDQLLR